MDEYLFNVDNGYLEGLVRGFRSGILSRADYLNLVQCETIEGMLIGGISRSRGVWESYESDGGVCLTRLLSRAHHEPSSLELVTVFILCCFCLRPEGTASRN